MQDLDPDIERIRYLGDNLLDPEMALRMVEDGMDAVVVVRRDATIFYLNKQAEFVFGWHRSELYGKPITMLIPGACRTIHENHTAKFMADPKVRPMGLGMPLRGLRKSGEEFEAEINLSPLVMPQGFFVVASVRKKRDG